MSIETRVGLLPFRFAKRHQVVIKDLSKETACIAYPKVPSINTLSELIRVLNRPLTFEKISTSQFEQVMTQSYAGDSSSAMQAAEEMGEEMDLAQLIQSLPQTEDLLDAQDDAPVIRLLNALFNQALKARASDIHIESFETTVQVRFRIDGRLVKVLEPQRVLSPLLVSRIKIMAKLDIAEKRIPQDGRISLRIAGRPVDVRVSVLPSIHGERVVMRLLDKENARLNLTHLGMGNDALVQLRQIIQQPNGIFLVTGPTGSGKTTTLYAALTELNDNERNILTVEDPVEYDLPGVGQTQINPKIDLTFARALRAILRQDPDVVMVGEIRDLETATIAVQASLTGHLVLSTLHTNSAIGAITRLRDMGVEPYLLASSLIGVAAQRLVRLLCPACKETVAPTQKQRELLSMSLHEQRLLYRAKGCEQCDSKGYQGRSGIYELIPMTPVLQALIHDKASEAEILSTVRITTPSIFSDGLRRVVAGETTMEEVLRVTDELTHDGL